LRGITKFGPKAKKLQIVGQVVSIVLSITVRQNCIDWKQGCRLFIVVFLNPYSDVLALVSAYVVIETLSNAVLLSPNQLRITSMVASGK
jgi:hypothetical protein